MLSSVLTFSCFDAALSQNKGLNLCWNEENHMIFWQCHLVSRSHDFGPVSLGSGSHDIESRPCDLGAVSHDLGAVSHDFGAVSCDIT